jgi:hypothetical protein
MASGRGASAGRAAIAGRAERGTRPSACDVPGRAAAGPSRNGAAG